METLSNYKCKKCLLSGNAVIWRVFLNRIINLTWKELREIRHKVYCQNFTDPVWFSFIGGMAVNVIKRFVFNIYLHDFDIFVNRLSCKWRRILIGDWKVEILQNVIAYMCQAFFKTEESQLKNLTRTAAPWLGSPVIF